MFRDHFVSSCMYLGYDKIIAPSKIPYNIIIEKYFEYLK